MLVGNIVALGTPWCDECNELLSILPGSGLCCLDSLLSRFRSVVSSLGAVQEEGWLVKQVLVPVLQTLVYLHRDGIIHRDIKVENRKQGSVLP